MINRSNVPYDKRAVNANNAVQEGLLIHCLYCDKMLTTNGSKKQRCPHCKKKLYGNKRFK